MKRKNLFLFICLILIIVFFSVKCFANPHGYSHHGAMPPHGDMHRHGMDRMPPPIEHGGHFYSHYSYHHGCHLYHPYYGCYGCGSYIGVGGMYHITPGVDVGFSVRL